MAHNGQSASSSLYLPLVGQEQAIRLEEKYGHFLDDESEPIFTTNQGKTSQWNLETKTSSEWLNSNKGTSAPRPYGGGKHSLHQNKKRSNPISRPGSATKQQVPEKSLRLPETARNNKKGAHPDKTLEAHNKCIEDVSGFSREGTREAEVTDEWNNGSQSYWDMPLVDTERPKLAIMPSSDKVEFRLSTDESQPLVVVPATINQYLRDYQREGISFLYQHYTAKTGAILGDDMGLGKTIQVIGFLSALLGKLGNHMDTIHSIPKFIRQMSDDIPNSPPRRACKPFLIIGPSAVMYNWLEELETWGYFTASKFHGVDKETCLDNLKKQKLEIVVTTFETFRDNIARLNQIEWEAVIVDEVHKIKGLKAQVTQALRAINTSCRIGLTGTALQNNMTELWSLLDWAQPGVLGTLEQFENKFVQVIELGQRHDATKRELAQARKQKEIFSEIRKRMMLRRTKSLIADQLPSKEDMVVMCRLSDLQVSVYKAILTHPDMKLVLCAEDPCDCRSGKSRASCCYKKSTNGTKAWTLVFSFMHLLLKAANHMALLIPDKNTKEKQASLATSVCDVAFKDYPQFIEQTQIAASRTLSDPQYCGKMKVLQGLLSAFYANHDKVLIFSYSTRLLDIIEQYVISQGHEYRRIDGKVSSLHRQNIVVQFNRNSSIFLCLISTKAGSLGLNLTGANKVVIFDPNWNPSHDLQAQDRAYRIGQTRDVKVYRLVSAGTIEENIYLRQIYKQQLDEVVIGTSNARRYFHGIQGDKANRGELFGIKNMFSLRTENSCLTMDILKRNDQLERGLAGYDITRYVPPNKVSTENDEENSESDDESLVDSDVEEEEDEEFLRHIFGLGRSPIIVPKPHSPNKSTADVSLKHTYQDSVKAATNVESDSDDDEISLIPQLYKKKNNSNLAYNTEKRGILAFDTSTSAPQGTSPMPDAKSGVLYNSTFSDITFSSKTFKTSDVLQHQSTTTETRKRGAVSGISWLFSDSDDDDEEESKKLVAKDTHKSCIDTDSTTYKTSAPAISIPEEFKSSVHNVRGSNKPPGNILTPKHSGLKASSTTARTQFGAENENVTLEQLVLKSSDVLHTHANAQIVGSSRAEDHMTRCAMKDVFELHTNSQAPALQCDPYSQDEDSIPTRKKNSRKGRNRPKDDHNTVKCISSGSFKILIGQTPTSIKRQQWSDFCKFTGVDQLTLAKTLLTADVEKRLSMLKEFYSQKHPQLADVMAQVFALKQTDQAPSVDQDTSRTKQSHRNKLISSVHAKKNSSTDNPVNYDPSEEKSHRDPSHPSSRSKSNWKNSKPLTKLFNKSCLSSQSGDSLTALSPEKQDFPSDNRLDSFLPIPPSASRKPGSSVKVLSRSRTRLRNKSKAYFGGDGFNEDNSSFIETDRGKRHTKQHSTDGSLLDSVNSNIDVDRKTLTNAAKSKTLLEPIEDIHTLLHDMGQNNSVRKIDDWENCQGSSTHKETTYESRFVCDKRDCTALDPTTTDCPTTAKKHSKFGINTKKAGENNIACILDDIFSSCQNPKEKQNDFKKAELNEENKYTSRLAMRSDERASTSKCSEQSNFGIKVAKDRALSETDSVFDDLLRTSTLKDDRVDSFVSTSKKRNVTQKVTTTSCSDSKDGWAIDKEKILVTDIDDLSWCKFDTRKDSHKSDEGSWSLFS